MKVLKFGGTSVGSSVCMQQVRDIVVAQHDPVIIVVSALNGITDQLLLTAQLAQQHDASYSEQYDIMAARHRAMVTALDSTPQAAEQVETLLQELSSILQGVFLIRDLSPRTTATLVSYGERLSAAILAGTLPDATLYDSRQFIKTEVREGVAMLAKDLTQRLVADTFHPLPQRAIVPGFISSDAHTGDATTLGRGGSDYTAAILAAALDAEVLEIWTDVDGFMTADPRVISSAYTIPELSYAEAMELCHFGAKVVYPPTIYPVCTKNIPIRIRNTFNPDAPGSVIRKEAIPDGRLIRGISSIKDTTLINVTGLSMVGVIGVNRRIFSALAAGGISVFFVAQASSENSTSIGVRHDDATRACTILDEEFAKEIADGSMNPMQAQHGLATVAVVGQQMAHVPGIAGKLFTTLGRSGISMIACAQGASQMNISFVIPESALRKTLNVIHDAFFLSEYQVLNLILCGVGTVGSSLIQQLASQQDKLMREHGLRLNVVGLASSRRALFDREGIDLTHYRQLLDDAPASDIHRLHDEVIGMNIFNAVFVDCTASEEVAGLYHDFLDHNISVVAANKIAASGDYAQYRILKETAQRSGVKYLFETNVGAGLPIIRTINDLVHSGDRILRIEAVLSGTLNYIFNTISHDIPFSQTVRMAKEEGYSEPDPRIDLSGKDVMRKLVILAREAGYHIEQSDVEAHLFIPSEFFQGDVDTFWRNLPTLDADFEQRRAAVEAAGCRWRFVACYEDGHASVALREIPQGHPFYGLEGSNNIVLITTERYHDYPMLIQGYGAGASVTAAGVFADIMSIANI